MAKHKLFRAPNATLIAGVLSIITTEKYFSASQYSSNIRFVLLGAFAAFITAIYYYIYNYFYNRSQLIRGTTSGDRPGKYEGLWLQGREWKQDDSSGDRKYSILSIEYDVDKKSHVVRGIAFEKNIEEVSCIFEGAMENLSSKNLKFETHVMYINPYGVHKESETISTLDFENKHTYKFINYSGRLYDAYRKGYASVDAIQILQADSVFISIDKSEIPNNFDFTIPSNFSFEKKYTELKQIWVNSNPELVRSKAKGL